MKTKYWVPSFAGNSLAMAAYTWMQCNTAAMDCFESLALQALQQKKCFGIDLIRGRVRWDSFVQVNKTDDYCINNTHSPYIARYLLQQYPALKPYLRIKKLSHESIAAFQNMVT